MQVVQVEGVQCCTPSACTAHASYRMFILVLDISTTVDQECFFLCWAALKFGLYQGGHCSGNQGKLRENEKA